MKMSNNEGLLEELYIKPNIGTFKKSIPSAEKSRGIFNSRDSRTSGSGMDRPAKNSLFLNTFMCLGMKSPVKRMQEDISKEMMTKMPTSLRMIGQIKVYQPKVLRIK